MTKPGDIMDETGRIMSRLHVPVSRGAIWVNERQAAVATWFGWRPIGTTVFYIPRHTIDGRLIKIERGRIDD